jgi:fumarate hydratase class II
MLPALSQVIGYDKASQIAHIASDTGQTLEEAALKSGFIDKEKFDKVVNAANMI